MASAFGKILLITGSAEFLAQRVRTRAITAVIEERPDCEVTVSSASGLGAGEFATLASPSLFSPATAVVLTDLQDLPDAPAQELLTYVSAPADEIVVILVHSGGNKGKSLLDKLRKQSAVSEVKVSAPGNERDFVDWIRTEARDLGRSMDEQAANLLLASVGKDLRSLAGAVDQLVATVDPTEKLSAAVVGRYFGGRADVRGYEIADAAIDGRLALALERTRWAEESNVPAVLVTAAVASGLRQLAALATAPSGLRDNELAALVGVPPFKVRSIRQQLRHWDSAGVRKAIEIVAQADLDVKGGAANAAYAIERMVLGVAAQRR